MFDYDTIGKSPTKDRLVTIRVRSGEYDFKAGRATFTVVDGGETISFPIDAIEDIKSAQLIDEATL
jgi:hypothetical protein